MAVKGNYYAILGVSPGASEEEIKERYKNFCLENHSDKGGNEEELKEVTNVYNVLGNPHQRLKYDLGVLKTNDNTKIEYIEPET